MNNNDVLNELYTEITTSLRPKALPFGVKLFKTLDERPPKTMMPRHPMNTCQITSFVRYQGRAMYNYAR